jgi:hypothetical protein
VTLNGDEIRRSFLQIIYSKKKRVPEDPWVSKKDLCKLLGVTEEVVNDCIIYFHDQEFLEVDGDPWETVRLSPKGLIVLDARMNSYCPYL